MSTNQNLSNDGKLDADSWSSLNNYLIKERDSLFSILTHVRLAIAAGAIIAIISCTRSFTGPILAYLELREGRDNSQYAILLMIVVGLSSFGVLALILFALFRLHRRFRLALFETLKKSRDSVESTFTEAHIEIPEKTKELLESLEYD